MIAGYSSLTLAILLTALGLIAFASGGSSRMWKRLVLCVTFLLAYLYSTAYLTIDSLTGRGVDESVVYHLQEEIAGAGTDDFMGLLASAIAAILVGLGLAYAAFRYAPRIEAPARQMTALSALVVSFAVHPLSFDLHQLSENSAERPVQVVERYEFQQAYRDPRQIREFDPQKNLIYIYMESLERTYFDEDLFPDVVPHLRDWEQQGFAFTNIDQARGTGWTIGGMVASQCGIPLVTMGSGGNSMSGAQDFLPGATCLGDMLKDAGYQLAYVGGAKLAFSGKGRFYETHGFDVILGKDAIVADNPAVALTDWGVFDDTLFDIAFDQYTELSAARKPFGLFALTLDTHHPKGNPSPRCVENDVLVGDNSSLDSVRCTDYLVDEFINRVFESEHGDDTLIVVTSDHFAMPNAATDVLQRGERRNTFFVLEKGAGSETYDTPGTTLDIPATLLSYLGYPGEAFGLGRDLTTGETLASLDPTFARVGLWKMANNVREFWMMPNIRESSSIDVNVTAKRLRIGDREYQIPILMSANSNGLIDRVFFQEIDGPQPVAFTEHSGTTIAVERCAYFESELDRDNPGFCLFVKNQADASGQLRALEPGPEGGFVTEELDEVLRTAAAPGFVNATLNPLILSSAIGQVPSGIYGKETQLFKFGLNVVGISDGEAKLIQTINPCTLAGKPPPTEALIRSIAAELAHEYDYLAIASHHLALCGDPSLKSIFTDSPLTAIDDKVAYVGVLDNAGTRIVELNDRRTDIAKLFITDLYPGDEKQL